MNNKLKEYLINKVEEMKACANSDEYTEEERQACRIALDAYKDVLDYVRKPSKNRAKIRVMAESNGYWKCFDCTVNGDLLLYYLRESFPYKTTAELFGIKKELMQKIKKLEGIRLDGKRLKNCNDIEECIAIETKEFLKRNNYTTRKLYEMEGLTIWENLIYV